jgi:hypothetical protein
MALPPSLVTELRAILAAFHAAHGAVAVPGGAGKALEAWLLLKLAETARLTSNWQVTLRSGDGSLLASGADFRLPDQPSPIAASNPLAACYVLLEHVHYEDRRLELHGGLQWMGRSGARHECDVSVIPAVIGEALRASGGGYPRGLPIAAIECKDKTSPGTPDEMRQTLARLFDLALITQPAGVASCRIYETNTLAVWGRRSSKYVAHFESGAFGIARAGDFQLSARRLGEHYHIGRFRAIYDPASHSISSLLSRFRTVLATVGYL